ncbi:MAG: deoxyribose-phosphate aldolase [Acidobacteria bacterium]|nr:deoxyribose-phosphate aldolase [Acidobacteriota bacterium]
MVKNRLLTVASLARCIDHTLLRPDADRGAIERLCEEAIRFQFAAVCVNPYWVPLARRLLTASAVRVCTVAGFPLGACPVDVKCYEVRRAISDGAAELDMVINIGVLKSGEDRVVHEEICKVVELCHSQQALCKVIIETAFLNDDEKIKVCRMTKEACADFVKTSTGFGPSGATTADVSLLRSAVGPTMGIKAAGGIRDLQCALGMLEAGATRIGSSAGVKIMAEATQTGLR